MKASSVRAGRRRGLGRPRRALGSSRQAASAAIGSAFVRFLRGHARAPVEDLLRDAGLRDAQLADPDATVELAAVQRLITRAADVTGDPGIGVRFAARVPWRDLGVLGFVLLHSPTLGAALANAARYVSLHNNAARITLDVDGDAAIVAYDVRGPHRPDQGAELTLAVLTRLCREGCGRPGWAPREVRFRHRAPASPTLQRRFFAAPLRWQQGLDALVLDAKDLRVPMATAEDGLLPILLRHADESLARMPRADDFTDDVRAAIASALRDGDANVARVAAALGTSARTLQRRLAEHGRRFGDVVDDTRLALARRYLADPALSLTETAFLVGYHDLSAFSRAFRRWTGETARAARQRATAAAASSARRRSAR
jgi:AraC-like DNA-binding protein